jgi:hypothetical protein
LKLFLTFSRIIDFRRYDGATDKTIEKKLTLLKKGKAAAVLEKH